MTGIELVKAELISKGFTSSKVSMNLNLIEAVITILSDDETRSKIDLASQKLKEAKEKENKAFYELEAAKHERRDAVQIQQEAKRMQQEVSEMLDDAKATRFEIKRALECETEEARDRVRLLELFKLNLPENCDSNQNALIYSMGAILSGQSVNFSKTKGA